MKKYTILIVFVLLIIQSCSNALEPVDFNRYIEFSLPQTSFVKVFIENSYNTTIVVLYKGELNAGKYTFVWNGRDKNGGKCIKGFYIAIVERNGRLLQKQTLPVL